MVRHYTGFEPHEECNLSEPDVLAILEEAKRIIGISGPHKVEASVMEEVKVDISKQVQGAVEDALSHEQIIDSLSPSMSHLYADIDMRILSSSENSKLVEIIECLIIKLNLIQGEVSQILDIRDYIYTLYGNKATVENRGKNIHDLEVVYISGSRYYLDLNPGVTVDYLRRTAHGLLSKVKKNQFNSSKNKKAA